MKTLAKLNDLLLLRSSTQRLQVNNSAMKRFPGLSLLGRKKSEEMKIDSMISLLSSGLPLSFLDSVDETMNLDHDIEDIEVKLGSKRYFGTSRICKERA